MSTFRELKNKSLRMMLLTKNMNWKSSPPTPDALDDVKLTENKRDTPIPSPQNIALLKPLESHPYTNGTNNSPGMIFLHKKGGGRGWWRSFRAIPIRLTDILPQPLGNRLADPSEEEHS